ncbi:hypothetical protein B0G76_0597 [Paraburkholderia sp. BL23I1N1]|nr:hypothetical protein B0G76_0597 [Paraburkholderia sp. BL23I1N1]
MAQCGSGAALSVVLLVFEFRKNVVSDIPNSVLKRESPFHVDGHACRPDCGACCIAPSISSPIPGMPNGKPAGVRCVQLGDDLRCAIFGQPERPACCSGLQPQADMCGASRSEALAWLTQLETLTQPQQAARR